MNINKDLHGLQHIEDRNRSRRSDTTQERQRVSVYESPYIISYTDQDILELLGPAQTGGEYDR